MAGLAAPAFALPTSPSLKPRQQVESIWVDTSDLASLDRALQAADADRWSDVRAAIGRIKDPAAKLLLQWKMATDGDSGMSHEDLTAAAETFRDWPGRNKIQDQIEITILRSRLTADQRIAFLRERGPVTAEGILALADSYHSLGRHDDRLAVIRDAYRNRVLDSVTLRIIETEFGGQLSADDHWARLDMLLWRSSTSNAQALLPRVSSSHRKLAEARIALMRNQKSVDPVVQAVPAEFQDDPGLLLERARWRERRGQQQGELEMLLRIQPATASVHGREAIWSERHSVARRLVRERRYSEAYQLCAGHGLTSGESFRDAEWMAGWIAMKMRDPAKAEGHFRVFGAGVNTPISIARANYWLGEALSAQERGPEAQVAYEAAAKFPFVFYGQLAAERIKSVLPQYAMLSLAPSVTPTDADRTAFAQRPEVRAAILLAETGRLGSFESFSNHIDDQLTTPMEHQLLFDIAQGYLETRAAVRGGKAGLGRGLVAPDAVFPILPLPPSPRTGSAEPAMVLALSRQESEFNSRAVSSANARGLMQMVPLYAQDEARKVGLPYRQSWLTDDPTYNLRLGRGFLDDLVDRFGGSYILAAAAYNAGPSRAVSWLNEFGDPRVEADPVDWIESIPFAETRNYVQRVMENMIVYRHRLSGQPVEINLSRELKRGRPR